ncbi:polymorphic toxin type 15 domain-containing protein [Gordonia sp. ABSL1-1]|uniref:polymorphic toxin type 15 domain-containing protein n=1 Tax=Gordonia sp. ABSL1-1 TaxID=3053923 RepID=UPI00257331FC|nr:polymorphic toxin type 15 domain-containing protein [Gordonia sp. ABSL1-1]MDL9937736.1 polymorphic toxin type 15 domain-containing protein [Gordonia sp. ABSL1-1]
MEFVPSTGGHSDPAAIPAHVRESLPGGDGQGQGGRHAANDHDGNGPGRERGPDGNRDDTGPPHRRGESPEEQSQRRQQDEAANRKMAEERIDKQVKALQKSEEAIAKAMKAVPSTEQGVSQVVSHMAHTAPDALTMVVVGTAVTGVAAAKGVHHLVTRAIEAVRAKVAGWRARFGGDEGGAQPHSPASRDGDGHAGSEGRVGDRDGSDGPARELPQSHRDGDGPAGGERPAAGDRVSLGDLPTRASVDEAAGKIDSTNSSGRGCADGAVGMRDLIATGESSVPADRGADYAGQSVNELAGRLGGDRFTHADVESIRATLEGLGDRASATIVGRHPDGELHAVTVMRVDGEFVVVDPSAPAGHRVSDLGAGLKHFSEMGAVFHDGHRPVRASDSRVTHPSELGPRKAFGEHERVGTRRDPEEGTNADGDEDGGSGVGQRHGEDAVDGDHTDSDDAATPVDPAEVARQANHDRIQSVIDDARARQAALNRARLDLEAAEKAGAPKSEIDAAKERVDRAKNDFDVANDRQSREVEGAYNVREDSDGKTHYRRRAGGEAAGYPQLRVDDDGLPALVEPKPPSPGEAAQRQELADALAEARNDPAAARTDPEKVITKVRDEHRDGLRADERARYSRELDESQTNTEHRDNPDNDLTYEYERHAGDHMRPTVDRQELAAQVESQRHGLETRSIDELIASIEGYDSKHRDSTAATRQQRRSELAALVELALLTEGYKPAVATRLASAYSDVQLRGNGSDQVITHNQDQVMGGRRSAETYGDSDANGMLGSLSKNEKDEFLKWLKARSDEFGGSAIYVSIRI